MQERRINIIVSACLLGINCKYDGSNNSCEEVIRLKEFFNLVPCCAEILGGLTTPREPSEIRDKRVFTRSGIDVTASYLRGANEILKIAGLYNASYAILKERSPSCGHGIIYDGTFTSTRIKGDGTTAELLEKNGIYVYGESDLNNSDCLINKLYKG